jgi:hypothetical protein
MAARLMVLKVVMVTLIVGAGAGFLAPDVSAQFRDRKLDQEAWACSGSYRAYPAKVLNGKDRETAICVGEGKRKPMARSEAYNRCRQQFSATSLLINWTSQGWRCRYYGH